MLTKISQKWNNNQYKIQLEFFEKMWLN